MIKKYKGYEFKLEKDGKGWYAHCDKLPGLHVGGDTIVETMQMIKNATNAYLASLKKHGEKLP